MPDYKITQEGLKEIKKRVLKRLLLIFAVIFVFIILMSVFTAKSDQDLTITMPVTLVVVILLFTFSIRSALKNLNRSLSSYTLTVTDEYIARYQINIPTIKIPFTEIKAIERKSKYVLFVKGNSPHDIIQVFSQAEHYLEIESRLSHIRPIQPSTSKNLFLKYPAIYIIVLIGLMAAVYISMNKIVVLICSLIINGIMIWSFFKIQSSKNVEIKTRRFAWFIWIVIFSVVSVTIMKLIGTYKP